MDQHKNTQKYRKIPYLEFEVVESNLPAIKKEVKPVFTIDERKQRWMQRIKRLHIYLSFFSEVTIEIVKKLVPVSLVLSSGILVIGFIGFAVVRGIQWIRAWPETPYVLMAIFFILLLSIVFVFARNGQRQKVPFDYNENKPVKKEENQSFGTGPGGNINIQINQNK